VIRGYDRIKAAFSNPDLSRGLDYERFERGNVKEGTLSVLHGQEHFNRRRMETKMFRRDMFDLYEKTLFPQITERTLDRFVDPADADVMEIGGILNVVLACRTAGIDIDPESAEERQRLRNFLHRFALGGAIDAANADPEDIKAQMQVAMREFHDEFLGRSAARRAVTVADGSAEGPFDMLTTLLMNRDETGMDDALIERETILYFTAGAHTSTQTLTNTMHQAFAWCADHPADWERLRDDRAFVQRCVHETLRLRPTNPGIQRMALADTSILDVEVRAGPVVLLDVISGNTDPAMYGDDADRFDPDRVCGDNIPPYGHSFGAGPHFCIGRTLAVGVPQRAGAGPGDDHLYGMVPIAAQAIARRGVRPHPDKPAVPDDKTKRWTRWVSYPVVFEERW
jgi:cytochrome P450